VRPVARELLERQCRLHLVLAALLAAPVVVSRVDGAAIPYELAAAALATGLLFLPAVQKLGAWQQPAWDAAMPMDRAPFALVRLASGTAWAASVLAAAVGVHAVLFGIAGAPPAGGGPAEYRGWYAPALLATGLTCYLLGSAVVLRAGDELRAMSCLCALFLVYCVARPPVLLPLDPAVVEGMGAAEALARAALPLALACAAAYAAARSPARAAAGAGPVRAAAPAAPAAPLAAPAAPPARAPRPAPARPPAHRTGRRPVRRGGPARAAAAAAVFRQHFEQLHRFTVLPLATLLLVAVLVLVQLAVGPDRAGEGRTVRFFVESTWIRGWCAWLALSWTVLVWLDEWGAQRRWNDALPVDTAERRVVHAAAGAAWLLLYALALAAGPLAAAAVAWNLPSPADPAAWLWLELPLKTATLYLAACSVLFCARMALRVPVVGPVFLWVGYMFLEKHVPIVADLDGWSRAASALRLVLYAAAAAGAIALSDWVDRHDRLPGVEEAKGFLRRALRPVLTHTSTHGQS
jgi:hypothetical protein